MPTLKATVDSLDTIAEPLQPYYVQAPSGGYRLDLDAVDDAARANEKRISDLTATVTDLLVNSEVQRAVTAQRGNLKLLEPVLRRRLKAVEDKSGFSLSVTGTDGQPLRDARGQPVNIDSFVLSLKADPDYAQAFAPPPPAGSGAATVTPPVAAGPFVLTREQARDHRQYRRAKEQAKAAGQSLTILS